MSVHLVQLTISLEDERIQRDIYDAAQKQIIKDLEDEFRKIVFDDNQNGRYAGITPWTEEQFRQFLNKNRDNIVEKAAGILAEKLSRSKAVKEIASSIAESASK